MIDSPGVVFDDDEGKSGAGAILRNGIDADSIDDPIPAIEDLLERCTMESLMMTYNIPAFPSGSAGVMTFLAMVARSKGRVLKGGVPDKIMAARAVLKDWNQGKIPYFSSPPQHRADIAVDAGAGAGADAKIVTAFSKEFDVDKILEAHDKELMEGLEDVDEMDFVQMTSSSSVKDGSAGKVLDYLTKNGADNDEEGSMDEDDDSVGRSEGAAMNARMENAEDFFE